MSEYKKFLASNVLNIFDALDDGVYVTDIEGTTLHVNSMYEKLTGLKSGELLGQNVRVLKEKGIFDTVVNPIIVETRKPQTNVQTLQDGKRVVLSGFPVFDDKKVLVLVITLVRDVTLLEQMRGQISQQKSVLSIYEHQIEHFSAKDSENYSSYQKPLLEKLCKPLNRVTSKNGTILLVGETGVGKNLAARQAHENSPRKNEIFLKIDCHDIAETRIESELFGFVPEALDAFTSSNSDGKMGAFEIADNGTVCLDEIGELPLTIQAKLLQLLQDKEVMRVGSPVLRKVDVRIIATTDRNLEDEINKGNFSRDLFEMLRDTIIDFKPLREIPEITQDLVNHFLKLFGARYKTDLACPDEAMSRFLAYPWPGNIPELKNTVHNLIITCQGGEILPQHLPPCILGPA